MDFPKLNVLVPVPAVQVEPPAGAGPVIALFKQSKLRLKFLLTWAAATHCPRFLNPEQDCCADSPVREVILSDNFVFWVRSWSMVLPWVVAVPPPRVPAAPFALALAWLAPMPLGTPIGPA